MAEIEEALTLNIVDYQGSILFSSNKKYSDDMEFMPVKVAGDIVDHILNEGNITTMSNSYHMLALRLRRKGIYFLQSECSNTRDYRGSARVVNEVLIQRIEDTLVIAGADGIAESDPRISVILEHIFADMDEDKLLFAMNACRQLPLSRAMKIACTNALRPTPTSPMSAILLVNNNDLIIASTDKRTEEYFQQLIVLKKIGNLLGLSKIMVFLVIEDVVETYRLTWSNLTEKLGILSLAKQPEIDVNPGNDDYLLENIRQMFDDETLEFLEVRGDIHVSISQYLPHNPGMIYFISRNASNICMVPHTIHKQIPETMAKLVAATRGNSNRMLVLKSLNHTMMYKKWEKIEIWSIWLDILPIAFIENKLDDLADLLLE